MSNLLSLDLEAPASRNIIRLVNKKAHEAVRFPENTPPGVLF
jgi:hypothetical protein